MIRPIALIFILASIILLPVWLYAFGGGNALVETPRVIYEDPPDGATLDLTGKNELIFKWQPLPIPSGGRECYKFTLYKESGYGEIVSQIIDPRTFSVSVGAEKFEDGKTYRWSIKQRDDWTMNWSRYDVWYFKVVKK